MIATTSDSQIEAITQIVRAMCEHGFLCGWFGDTSPEFQSEEVYNVLSLNKQDRIAWLSAHTENLIRYCGISRPVILAAVG